MKKSITVNILRSDPAGRTKPEMRSYRIPFSLAMTVSDALHLVNELSGEAVAYLAFCRQGVCGGCLVKVNGQARLACCTPVEGDLTIEPAFPDMVIKDLVTGKGAVLK